MAVKIRYNESQHKEEIKELLRQGKTVQEIKKQYPEGERTIWRYKQQIKDEQSGKAPPPTTPGSTKVATPQKPTEMATVTTPAPGPIVFNLGSARIDLEPSDLYDAWRYCEDIKRIEPFIDDSFSAMVKVACKRTWEFFSQREAQRVGVTLKTAQAEKGD